MKGYDIYKIKNPDCIYWDENEEEIRAFLTEGDDESVIVKTPAWLKTVIKEAIQTGADDATGELQKSLRDLLGAKKE